MMIMGGCFQHWIIPYELVLSEWANEWGFNNTLAYMFSGVNSVWIWIYQQAKYNHAGAYLGLHKGILMSGQAT